MRDPHGYDMARKATWQCHAGPRERLHGTKVALTHGRATRVHADARVAPRGRESGWQVMDPRVSGPRLDSWGGNANVLFSPTFYTYQILPFPPSGTMFPFNLFFAGHVVEQWSLDAVVSTMTRRSRGLGSTRSPSKHMC